MRWISFSGSCVIILQKLLWSAPQDDTDITSEWKDFIQLKYTKSILAPSWVLPIPGRACNKIWDTFMNVKVLTHWGRVTHICISKLTIIVLDKDLSPGRRGAITWTNAEC